MRRLPAHTFGILMSVEPGIAALAGFALLGQHLHPRQVVAIALVVVASAGASLRARAPALPPDA
jgi:inner membrane transporter RhtA